LGGFRPGNVCNQGLGGFGGRPVLGGLNPGFTDFGGFRGYLGFGSFSP
jgi:hypothetical protein